MDDQDICVEVQLEEGGDGGRSHDFRLRSIRVTLLNC
jgi:hypothetical protein